MTEITVGLLNRPHSFAPDHILYAWSKDGEFRLSVARPGQHQNVFQGESYNFARLDVEQAKLLAAALAEFIDGSTAAKIAPIGGPDIELEIVEFVLQAVRLRRMGLHIDGDGHVVAPPFAAEETVAHFLKMAQDRAELLIVLRSRQGGR